MFPAHRFVNGRAMAISNSRNVWQAGPPQVAFVLAILFAIAVVALAAPQDHDRDRGPRFSFLAVAPQAHSSDARTAALCESTFAVIAVARRSPCRISRIAPRIAIDANTTRIVSGSEASSHPRNTATTGLAYVCVATSAGGHRCSNHV